MRKKSIVYICSPYRGDVIRNKTYARELTADAISLKLVPITPHLYITECLDDNNIEERELGLKAAIELLIRSDLVFLGKRYGISSGMQAELSIAKEYGIPIIEKGLLMTD